ncbi:glycosyltransferase family 2 protein [Sunxiuqinia rutila]|uniref:glycosyltransferase family 2 protein n=1 Tax=Sunxiuqinia rutila TaxID=1397841 RepID=UPI003D35B15F
MSYTDLLTISMPVYERKDFFLTALESALNQTVKCKIIVVDNCSSHDYFEKVCEEKGVPYYRNSENIGMAGNFARGFELASSEFVMNLQDDDQLSPIYVESFLEAYNRHPNIDIFYSDFIRLTNEGMLPHKHTLPFGYMENGQKIIEYGIRFKLGFPYMASAIKRSIVKGFEANIEGSGCYDWVWIYSEADEFSFYGDSRKLYVFRDHDEQDTKRNLLRYAMTLPYIYDEILREKVADVGLKRKATRNAFWELIRLKTLADKGLIDDFVEKNTVFSSYLKHKLEEDGRLRLIFRMPRKMVWFNYRVIQKLKLNT